MTRRSAEMYPAAFWELVREEVRRSGARGQHGAALRELLRGFHERADSLGSYLDDPATRAAYLRAFLPYEMDKVAYVLGQVGARLQPLLAAGSLRVLDAGCGPGSASLGLLGHLGSLGPALPRLHLSLSDRSGVAVEIASRLAAGLGRILEHDVVVRGHRGKLLPDEPVDIVILQNCLSEAADSVDGVGKILQKALALAPAGLVVAIEPADRKRSRLLLAARDAVLGAGGARVLAPCLRQGACPALHDPGDWCFMERPFEMTSEQRMGLRESSFPRRSLKFSYVVLESTRIEGGGARSAAPRCSAPGEIQGAPYRVVSDVLASKGARELFVCGESGRPRLRLLTRHASDANREVRRLRRGDVVELAPAPAPGAALVDLGVDSSVRRGGASRADERAE